MKSYRLNNFGSLDHIIQIQEEMPEPRTGEVLVKVRATSLNYRDLALVYQQYTLPSETGHIPLSDAAGKVIAIGEGVTRFKVGDRVVNSFYANWFGGEFSHEYSSKLYSSVQDGWLTEYKRISEEALVVIPDYLSYEEAATLPCAAVTAWSALLGPNAIKAGDTVLTQGSGGVSLFAIQFAKLLGANVIATTSDVEKARRLRLLGADEIINYREHQKWGEIAKQLTEGKGVDKIIEVGGPGTLNQSLQAIGINKEIVLIGFIASSENQLSFDSLFRSHSFLRTISVGSRDDLQQMMRALSQHQLKPVIDQVFSFENALSAWQYFDTRKHFGKVVITH